MSGDAAQPGEDGPTLEQILAEAERPAPVDWQETIGGILRDGLPACPDTDYPLTYTTTDTPEFVANVAAQDAGRGVGLRPLWLRFTRKGTDRHALLILSGPDPLLGADLIVIAHRSMFTRGLIRFACMWAFKAVGLRRLLVRVPVDRPDLSDYARRAGFVFEGTAQDLYGPGLDGQVWAMSAARCRWLPQAAPALPTRDTSPPVSLRLQ